MNEIISGRNNYICTFDTILNCYCGILKYHEGPRLMDGVHSVGVILRDPNPYLREFEENHGRLRTARPTSATEE